MNNGIGISLSGIKVAKEQSEIVMQNIANANTEGYARMEASQQAMFLDGQPTGVSIASVRVVTDQFLNKVLYEKIAQAHYAEIMDEYHGYIEGFMGEPGEPHHLSARLSKCLSSLNQLSTHPNRASLRSVLLHDVQELTNHIVSTANGLQELKMRADTDLRNAVTAINNFIGNIYDLNAQLVTLPENSMEAAAAKTSLKQNIQLLSEYFDLRVNQNKNGTVGIETMTGINLTGDIFYQAKYESADSIESFVQDRSLNPFYITAYDKNGNDMNVNIIAIEGGVTRNRDTKLRSGVVAALAEMRDTHLPKFLEQLDAFAHTLRAETNKLHNEGNGFPPPSNLTGSREVCYEQDLNFSGKFRLTVLNDDGVQHDDVHALTIDLDQFNTGHGPGFPNVRGIVQEINHFFGERLYTQNRVSVGNIDDIKLVSRSKSFEANTDFALDLEIENFSSSDATVSILNVTAQDNTGLNILDSFDSSVENIAAGERLRSLNSKVKIRPTAGFSYPCTIAVQLQVKDSTGIHDATVNYVIDNPQSDPINGLYNMRFDAKMATGEGEIIKPRLEQKFLTASLVDSLSIPVQACEGSRGRLNLTAASPNLHIAIDQLDSSENELKLSLGAFFGLNDFFIHTGDPEEALEGTNSAMKLAIRKDIIDDARYIASGKLRIQPPSNIPYTKPTYKYELSAGDNENLQNLASLATRTMSFKKTSTLTATSTTLANYANEMNTYMAMEINFSNDRFIQAESTMSALKYRMNNITGVDINTELAKALLFQEIFASCSHTFKTCRDLFDILTHALM